jgi:hypothetical protein
MVFKRFQQLPMPLGRWHLAECPKKIDIKVDWSNEDHCGPCGEKVLKGKTYEILKSNTYEILKNKTYEMKKSDNNNNGPQY